MLELGCGTGRVTVPVVKAGATVVGVDLSAPMLARARTRLARAAAAGARSSSAATSATLPFRSRRGFGLVMAPYGILQSLTRERDLRATLASVARVLRRGGLFAHGPRARPAALERVPTPRQPQGPPRTIGTTVTLIESVRQDRARQLTIFDQEYVERRGRAGTRASIRADVPHACRCRR